jgi:hypothetical protein
LKNIEKKIREYKNPEIRPSTNTAEMYYPAKILYMFKEFQPVYRCFLLTLQPPLTYEVLPL